MGRVGTGLGWAEANPDQGAARGFVLGLPPARALMTLRTAHATALPIHHEVGGLKGTVNLLLPALIRAGRADQVYAMTLTSPDEVFSADGAGVHQVLGRGQPLG